MKLRHAVKSGFRKAFQFSGRADRSEFWKFVLFMVLGFCAAIVINSLIFGPEVIYIADLDKNSQPIQETIRISEYRYTDGWLGDLFFLICFVPWLSLTWRRMRDIGKPGYLPFITILGWILMVSVVAVIMIGPSSIWNTLEFGRQAVASLSGFPAAIVLVGLLGAISINCTWLAGKSRAGLNKFGAMPNVTAGQNDPA